jgi:GTP-binding protein LepA
VDVEPLPGYKEVKPVVFASVYPVDGDDYPELRDALEKLKLNDASLFFEPESSSALGRGFRCGFLGMLHLEIISERLRREYGMNLVITTPSVSYKIIKRDGKEIVIFSPSDMPDQGIIEEIQEPWAKLEIVLPKNKIGAVMKLAESSRASYKSTEYLSSDRVILVYEAPLINMIVDFYDNLKNISSGFASVSYDIIGFRKENLVKLDILVAGEKVEAFSRIVPEKESYEEGKKIVAILKDSIPKQNFAIALQAAISGKIIARETVKPYRKDVTAKLYGGDVTRKRKLLEKQKKGKKKMKAFGKVEIPQETFLSVLKKK